MSWRHWRRSLTLFCLSAIPASYKREFVHYATVDCPNSQIVRQMYINREAFTLVKQSNTIPNDTVIAMETYSARVGSDQRLIPTSLNNVFVREKRVGQAVNDRSGDWHSAWYGADGSLVSHSQESCISCHTMVRDGTECPPLAIAIMC